MFFLLAQEKGYTGFRHNPNTNTNADALFWSEFNRILIELILVQKWLRDKHNLIVWIKPFQDVFEYGLYSKGDIQLTASQVTDGFCDTYEEALLEGVHNALKLLQ